MMTKFVSIIGQSPKQTAPMCTTSKNRGQYVVTIIEANIDNVLIGYKPVNKHITNARETLILMIDSLPEDSVVYTFIMETIKTPFKLNATVRRAAPTKKSPAGGEGANKISVNKESWINLNFSNFSNLEGGTYLFTQATNSTEYVGSASNYRDRLVLHRMQFRSDKLARALHKQEKDNQSTLFFSKIQIVTCFLNLFKKINPKYVLTLGEYEILLALTLYPVRVLEQALIDYIKPSINGNVGKFDTTVYHKFTSWDPTRLEDEKLGTPGTIPVDIYNLEGSLEFSAKSSNEASKMLSMSYRSVPLYLNNAKPFFSPTLEKFVTLKSPGFEGKLELKIIQHKKKASPLNLPNHKLDKLSTVFLYCFTEDKINFTTFFTLTQAFRGLFPKQFEESLKFNQYPSGVLNSIKSRINLDLPIIAENGLKYYFAKNPAREENEFRENAIIMAIEVNTLQAKIYASTVKVAEDLSNLGLTKRICTYYKDTGKIYKGYIFITYTNFINILPEIFVPGIDTYTLTDIQLNTLLTSYKTFD